MNQHPTCLIFSNRNILSKNFLIQYHRKRSFLPLFLFLFPALLLAYREVPSVPSVPKVRGVVSSPSSSTFRYSLRNPMAPLITPAPRARYAPRIPLAKHVSLSRKPRVAKRIKPVRRVPVVRRVPLVVRAPYVRLIYRRK